MEKILKLQKWIEEQCQYEDWDCNAEVSEIREKINEIITEDI